jgi:predicted DNA-binding transcriptional regulator AlpA
MTMSTAPARSAAQEPGGRLITMREIRARFRLGRTAAYELVRRPDFPPRIVVSPRCHRWLESEVDAFAAALRGRPAPAKRVTGQAQPPGAVPLRLTGRPRPVRARKAQQ